MSKRYHHRKRRMAEMNVVPYIDVMLVLLIIFMITSPLLTESVKVELPRMKTGTEPLILKEKGIIIVTVDANGQIFLQDETSPISEGTLVTRVAALIEPNKDTQVFVRGDKNVIYGKVIATMSLLKSAGIAKVSLVTQRQ
jgi:biopolymer transport protein TolR